MDYLNLGAWDVRVTIDLFLGGIGVGAFLLSVLLSIYDKEEHTLSIKLGAYIAPVTVISGLLILIWKLGVPSRFIKTFWNINLQSVMSIGVFLQTFFVIFSTYYAYLVYKNFHHKPQMHFVKIVGSFLALSVGLYHGLYMSSLGRVLWSELTPGMFIASSLTSGIAFVLLFQQLKKGGHKDHGEEAKIHLPLGLDRFRVMFIILLIVQLISIILWQYYSGRLDLEQGLSFGIFMENYGVIWTLIVLFGGTIIPMLLCFRSIMRREHELPNFMTILICVLILFGGFTMKHLMIIGGQIHISAGFQF